MIQPDASLAAPSSPALEAAPGTQVPPVCRDCAHLVGVRRNPEDAERWRCSRLDVQRDLVSGVKHYFLCTNVRADPHMCGTQGLWFLRYEQPEHRPSAGGKASADALLEQLEKL